MKKLTFKKHEKLTSEKAIKELFDKGSSFYLSPFKVLSIQQPLPSASSQVLISVPARNFKRAVDRNKIKRRVREAYRLNKSRFESGSKRLIAYIYVAKNILPSAEIHQKLLLTLEKLYASNEKK
jgi:ribonuclease P protein component